MDNSHSAVEALLHSILKNIGFGSNTHFDILPVQARLWLSKAYAVKTTSHDGKELNLFLKTLPGDLLRKELFDSPVYFRNEVAFYKNVFPKFEEFQRSRIKEQEAFSAVPFCYHAFSDGEKDTIVLKNIKSDGFMMPNSREVLGLPELHLVMRELGRFHAVSLAMKDQEPEKFKTIKDSLEETVWNERFIEKLGKRMFTDTCEGAFRLVKETHAADSRYSVALQRLRDNIVDVMKHQVSPNEPLSVITHGDFWVNNFMFQYSEPDVLERMCFLDFQQSRYASPAVDVGSALYMCMDKASRGHRDALLRSYHDSLGELMRALGSDPDELFPFEKLEEELDKYSIYGLCNAFMNIPQALDEQEAGVDEMELLEKLNGIDINLEGIVQIIFSELEKPFHRQTEICKQRIVDAIEDAVDRGYLDNPETLKDKRL
ncbi:hypothetical protein L9F63_010182 [Diploptera punctata]|uniref:CHK kinase-like domain-containing protein n=1 Tax=Diploptera punctata TaxID=6984 RepID=A0AAD8ER62_DIPPU|nr:hypothetical protein L9F63_010182 [Diploptera punctata]